MMWSRKGNCITERVTEMPRCCASRIQSEVAWRAALRPLTVPAIAIAPPNSSNFSVSVLVPASGCEIIAKVRRRAISSGRVVIGPELDKMASMPRRYMRCGAGYAKAGLRQQLLQPCRHRVGGVVRRERRGEAAQRVHDVDQRAVVHVVAATGGWVLGVEDLVILRRLRDLRRRARQRLDRAAKALDIGFEHGGRIPIRVDADEDDADLVLLGAELLERQRQVVERGRTDVRAMGVAEEHELPFTLKVGIGNRLAVLVEQAALAADRRGKGAAGDALRRVAKGEADQQPGDQHQ